MAVRDFSPLIEDHLRALEPISLEIDHLALEDVFVAATRGRES